MWFGFFLVKDVVAKIGTRYDKCYYVKKCYYVTIRMSLRYMYYLDVVIAFERTNRKTKLINWSPALQHGLSRTVVTVWWSPTYYRLASLFSSLFSLDIILEIITPVWRERITVSIRMMTPWWVYLNCLWPLRLSCRSSNRGSSSPSSAIESI